MFSNVTFAPARKFWSGVVTVVLLSSLAFAALAQSNNEEAGKLLFVHGTVELSRNDTLSAAQRGQSLFSEDILTTQAASSAQIRFRDDALVAVRPNSTFLISSYSFDADNPGDGEQRTQLLRGSLRAMTGAIGRAKPEQVEFETPVATMGIRGTVLSIAHVPPGQSQNFSLPEGTFVQVESGAVLVSNQAGAQLMNMGETFWVPDAVTAPLPAPPEVLAFFAQQNTQQASDEDDNNDDSGDDMADDVGETTSTGQTTSSTTTNQQTGDSVLTT